MAEVIGVASGLLALTAYAFQSSVSLCQELRSFQHRQKTIRGLTEDLEALDRVLDNLKQVATTNSAELTGLRLPLLRCGMACNEFKAVIMKCTAHSGGSKTSFRDWAKLRYLGDDIAGFRDLIAGYKSTISIALGTATLYVLSSSSIWTDC
jgi:hypothetical protein